MPASTGAGAPRQPVPGFDGRALVLAGGGIVGMAWMAGLAAGLRDAGTDLRRADLIVGTSAGAIVGTVIASGQDPADLAAPAPRPAGGGATLDRDLMARVFALLGDRGLTPDVVRHRVGELALSMDPAGEQGQLERIGALFRARTWPERRLLVTGVDAATGEPVAWRGDSGVPLLNAVAASSSFPGAAPPVTVGDRRYMDGGLRSTTNADLAAGARALVVVEPLAHLTPRALLERELARVGAASVLTVVPDAEGVAALGTDLYSRTAWPGCYAAGVRQAGELADKLAALWQ